MTNTVSAISLRKDYSIEFTICCIVSKATEYDLMKTSFESKGFKMSECEYLIADNTSENIFDAYTAINRFLQEAKGKYIIIVHQDVRAVDSKQLLTQRLTDLEAKDTTWAVCGNAGGNGYKNTFYYMNDNGRLRQTENLPAKVTSLDENLLIIKNGTNLSVSSDIKDFHFYGTDICIIADFLGYNAYVIQFMVDHLSSGNLDNMLEQQPAFITMYGEKLRQRFIQTSCTKFYLGDGVAKNNIYNKPLIFFWIKAYNRLKNKLRHGSK